MGKNIQNEIILLEGKLEKLKTEEIRQKRRELAEETEQGRGDMLPMSDDELVGLLELLETIKYEMPTTIYKKTKRGITNVYVAKSKGWRDGELISRLLEGKVYP